MGYEMYVEHPESQARREQDFAAWSMWAPLNAPWTGVSISDMAKLVQAICAQPMDDLDQALCLVLDNGGPIDPPAVQRLWDRTGSKMPEKTRQAVRFALDHRYPMRVVFSKGWGALSASAYLAKQLST